MIAGIHLGVPMEAYLADPAPECSLSSGVAQTILTRSPYHAWLETKMNPRRVAEESSRFDLGSAAHAMLLEQDDSTVEVVEADDWRTKAARERRDAIRTAGRLPVLAKHMYALEAMVKAARAYISTSELIGIFDQGKPEQTALWQDGGTWCRARFDWLTDDRKILLDYKTCDSAEPESFIRRIPSLGYDMQAALYGRGAAATTGERPRWVWLAQEIEPPYACSLVGLSNAYLEIANARVDRALTIWRECLASGKWPAYPSRICYAEPTNFQMAAYEQLLADQEGA